ncbi:hypothetical protein ACJMK2_007791 [Sinanodonta woodiana]|uniref:Uncharacterized protein n=1 Tax=Sinanodonta woodiana TaxID=1069815 RepID=A0ABD3VJK9_SINWO
MNNNNNTDIGSVQCTFDICKSFVNKYCLNDGLCMLDKNTCINYCICKSNYGGKRCEIEKSSQFTTTSGGSKNTSDSKSHCAQNIMCQHGICDRHLYMKGIYQCNCYQGWTGIFCETNINTTNITEDYSLGMLSTTPGPRYNVCTEHPLLRTLSERRCADNMICRYGTCKKTPIKNALIYDCVCDIGARGLLCEYKCCKHCGDHGECLNDANAEGNYTQYCDCHGRYIGEKCDVFVPEPISVQFREATWYLWVVGACAGALFILLLLLVACPYLMWRHRVILIMKVVHYFQPYEDDDNKKWDAFISYKSHEIDEAFVVRTLYPKLEKELGFKLCLHFRDFVPGESIVNNIISAVENSRRTIIILSPRYVESEFTQFEYQKAQHEMLKKKHRIIPVLLEDISHIKGTMDKSLESIIDTVTYIEWPGENNAKKTETFWKRVELSLPKKKDSNVGNMEQQNGGPEKKKNIKRSFFALKLRKKEKRNVIVEDVKDDNGNDKKANEMINPIEMDLTEKEKLEKELIELARRERNMHTVADLFEDADLDNEIQEFRIQDELEVNMIDQETCVLNIDDYDQRVGKVVNENLANGTLFRANVDNQKLQQYIDLLEGVDV